MIETLQPVVTACCIGAISRNPEVPIEAGDLVQLVNIELWRSAARIRKADKPAAYAQRIISRTVSNGLKDARRCPVTLSGELGEVLNYGL
jgi:DNA-directed RNA polymerase specialized sigma24 family protein